MPTPTESFPTETLYGPKGKIVVNASETSSWHDKGYRSTREAYLAAEKAKAEKAAAKTAGDVKPLTS